MSTAASTQKPRGLTVWTDEDASGWTRVRRVHWRSMAASFASATCSSRLSASRSTARHSAMSSLVMPASRSPKANELPGSRCLVAHVKLRAADQPARPERTPRSGAPARRGTPNQHPRRCSTGGRSPWRSAGFPLGLEATQALPHTFPVDLLAYSRFRCLADENQP